MAHRAAVQAFQSEHYAALQRSVRRNRYFHKYLLRLVGRHIPPNARVLDVGCGNGDMLAGLGAAHAVGIDLNPAAISDARQRHPEIEFHTMAAEDLAAAAWAPFDVIVLSGVFSQLYDLHTALENLRSVCHDRTRVVICSFSRLWQPCIRAGEAAGLKQRVPDESWIPSEETINLLTQCDFKVVRQAQGILLPLYAPVVSNLINRWVAPLPGIRQLCLCTLTVARMLPRRNVSAAPPSVSVVVPVRNEAGNVPQLLARIPKMSRQQEVIFVEGHSTDDTWPAVQKAVADYAGPFSLRAVQQTGHGKADAVRAGFALATGDILAILDGDISVPPEELARFVDLIARGQCEFANGSRLVYPMEKHAMQFLNMVANKIFGKIFTFLLGQNLRDTLCGTKVMRRSDYDRIAANRAYFGDFDPFGDFDLLFGAARLDLHMADVPVHYKQRTYGSTNISRFRHGLLLVRMCGFAARKLTFVR